MGLFSLEKSTLGKIQCSLQLYTLWRGGVQPSNSMKREWPQVALGEIQVGH